MQRRQLLQSLAGLSAAFGPAGAAHAQAVDESWIDTARQRVLPLRVRWPPGEAPCALVLHSHGLGGNRDGGDAWGEAWRAAGLAVIHVQHPGSDSEVWRRGRSALREAASGEQLAARVADMRFVIDEVERRAPPGRPWSRIQPGAIGASGHSFGAVTVQALAGKRFGPRTPEFAEPRLRAFVAFSPSLGRGDPRSPAEQFGAVARPFLAVTGSLDGDPLGSTMTGEDRARVYEGLPPGQRALLWLDGADHMSFGGNASPRLGSRRGPRRDPAVAEREPVHHALVARLTTLWWCAHLLGDRVAAAALRAPQGLGADDRWRSD